MIPTLYKRSQESEYGIQNKNFNPFASSPEFCLLDSGFFHPYVSHNGFYERSDYGLRLFFFSQVGADHLGVIAHFGRSALGNLAAEIEDDDPVGNVHHDSHIMFDENDTTDAIP